MSSDPIDIQPSLKRMADSSVSPLVYENTSRLMTSSPYNHQSAVVSEDEIDELLQDDQDSMKNTSLRSLSSLISNSSNPQPRVILDSVDNLYSAHERHVSDTSLASDTDAEPRRVFVPLPPPIPYSPIQNSSYQQKSYYPEPRATLPPGEMGLQNLGNTCFMNSALQCLSHTGELTGYFLSGKWSSDVNTQNPLGMNGRIANSYAEMTSSLWNGMEYRPTSYAPRDFKMIIGERNSTFTGYGQQDSHELLQCLLDGLHEDLNRITKKPYVEDPEIGEMTHDKFAEISWLAYLKRNNSIIVDLFQAQLKNRTECKVCGYESIKFDPYMYLQLPIPEPRNVDLNIILIPRQGRPAKFTLNIHRHSNIGQLKIEASKIFNFCAESREDTTYTFCFELWNDKIHVVFNDKTPISNIQKGDLVCIMEITDAFNEPPSELVKKEAFLGVLREGYSGTSPVGVPMIVALPRTLRFPANTKNETVRTDVGWILYSLVIEQISRFSRLPLYRRKDSGIASPIPVDDHGHLAYGTSWIDDHSGMWEPFPKLFSVVVVKDYSHQKVYSAIDEQVGSDEDVKHNVDQSVVRFLPEPAELAERILPETEVVSSGMPGHLEGDLPIREYNSNIGNRSSSPQSDCSRTENPDLPPTYSPQVFDTEFNFGDEVGSLKCEFSEHVYQSLFDYSGVFDPIDYTTTKIEEKPSLITIDQCLDEFSRVEILTGDEMVYCKKCKDHQPTVKHLSVYNTPNILIIQLKRFSNEGRARRKIDGLVDAPLKGLVIDSGNPDAAVYDLFAVSNHFGGMGGGHCIYLLILDTAYCVNPIDERWYNCDDSRISLCGDRVITEAAYLLFYKDRAAPQVDLGSIVEEIVRERREEEQKQKRKDSLDLKMGKFAIPDDPVPEIPLNAYMSDSQPTPSFVSFPVLPDNLDVPPTIVSPVTHTFGMHSSDTHKFLKEEVGAGFATNFGNVEVEVSSRGRMLDES